MIAVASEVGNAAALHHDQILVAKIVLCAGALWLGWQVGEAWRHSALRARRQRNLRRKRPEYVAVERRLTWGDMLKQDLASGRIGQEPSTRYPKIERDS